jgi:CheY-like chemotaxis protein
VLDLNEVLAGTTRLLTRLIGEDIQLVIKPGALVGYVRADAGQIEQVLLNLAANARDAMPRGGVLTLETANATLDASYRERDPEVHPGEYVVLAVSDTGEGMSEAVRQHLFEPFFTTKEVGKGTGLGLSTVYGIVKQSGGTILVYSEVGHGTVFKVYLPRTQESPTETQVTAQPLPRGHETVWVVEDNEEVRQLTVRMVNSLGYRVVEFGEPEAALAYARRSLETVHLLLTDVVMPQMGGRELAQRLTQLRPRLGVLYMSGYTDSAIVQHGVLEEGAHFIRKPFPLDALAQQLRQALAARE